MPNQSTSGGGGQSANRNRNRNSNRNKNRSRNRAGGSGASRNSEGRKSSSGRRRGGGDGERDTRGAGHRTGGYTREKVPRRSPKPSLWNRLLALVGLGGEKPKAKAKTKPQPKAKVAKAKTSRQASTSNDSARTQKGAGRQAAPKPSRPPEKVEVTNPRLYVGNLSYDATEEDLGELFNGVGTVSSAEVVTHRRSQRSKGYAFVTLLSVEEAKRAVDVLHDQDFMGRKLVVTGAKSSGPGSSGGSESDSA